jgi:small subunit ribosomal protein S24e
MNMEIIKQNDVPLLDRKRVTIKVTFSGKSTPTNVVIRKDVAKVLKVEPKLVVIRHIYQKYGNTEAKIIAHVYNSVEKLKVFEGEKAMLKEEPKTEVPVETPKVEAKETPKEEEKSE